MRNDDLGKVGVGEWQLVHEDVARIAPDPDKIGRVTHHMVCTTGEELALELRGVRGTPQWYAVIGNFNVKSIPVSRKMAALLLKQPGMQRYTQCELCGQPGTIDNPVVKCCPTPPAGGYAFELVDAHRACSSDYARSLVC
jgi:hypothetical protein